MGFVSFTARRYLLGRSRLGAAGWISFISTLAIALVTAALVCVLSVYNGYVALLLKDEAQTMPTLLIRKQNGGNFDSQHLIQLLEQSELITNSSKLLITQGLLNAGGLKQMCEVYGVDNTYPEVVPIASSMSEGEFLTSSIQNEEFVSSTLGIGLATQGALRETEQPPILLFPRREGFINPLVATSGFIQQHINITGVLAPASERVNQRIYLPLDKLRSLLNYTGEDITALALSLKPQISTTQVQQKIQALIGTDYIVQNREEQQPELTLLIKTEKIMVYIIMCFILILATFSLASSIVMLIMEKQQDINIFRAMGLLPPTISMIFAQTGLFISGIGSALGLGLGLTLCLLQQSFSFIGSGEGLNRIPFPIDLQWQDLIYILLANFAVTMLSAGIPIGLMRRYNNQLNSR